MLEATYVLPLRRERPENADDLPEYLRRLSTLVEVIVVDGSPSDVFAVHARAWGTFTRHIAPDPDLVTPMGKVGGVLTGLRYASYERVVIADDDVRYNPANLERLINLLNQAEVVRPQNFFEPLTWHALWDTARSLLNRMTGGDWPGTLAVRRSILETTRGYAGDVMFENLELIRTVQTAGGREQVALDLFVERKPPTTHHFWSQRVRQAYDEFARPLRLIVWLALLPLLLGLVIARRGKLLLGLLAGSIGLAECGRRRAGGTEYFPFAATLLAPAWLLERAVCSWLALASHLIYGGVRYRGGVLKYAATPPKSLKERYANSQAVTKTAANPKLAS